MSPNARIPSRTQFLARVICRTSSRDRTQTCSARSQRPGRAFLTRRLLGILISAALGLLCTAVQADDVQLRNGMLLNGRSLRIPGMNAEVANRNNRGPVTQNPIIMVDDGVRRYFVSTRQVSDRTEVDELGGPVSYQLPQKKTGQSSTPSVVRQYLTVQPFDEFGRRIVALQTDRGRVDIVQGITEIRPDYFEVESLTHHWHYALDTKTLSPELLEKLIDQSIKQTSTATNANEAMAMVSFYLQAEQFSQAQQKLAEISGRFPDMAEKCRELQAQVLERKALQAIFELERRQDAGQHRLALMVARKFPEDDVSAGVARQAREMVEGYEEARADADRALMMLDMLQAELPEERSALLRPLKAMLTAEMHYETVDRLEPFLQVAASDSVPAEEKLALAYSAWLLGSAQAITSLDEAIQLWDARFLALEYLRNEQNPARDEELLSQLGSVEAASVERLALMAPNLPLPFEAPPISPGTATEMTFAEPGGVSGTYTIQLPPEYTPHHRYPLLVVLRSAGSQFEDEVHWWAGDEQRPGWAQRRGYIVLAPHYNGDEEKTYSATGHEAQLVIAAIQHARKRFRIDSNRLFLAGHGTGGDACFDVAMSRPGWFAGAVPITGICDRFCIAYYKNAPEMAWYVVSGERDRNTLDKNAQVLNNMMVGGQDVVCCEYKSRGYESFFEEQERIFNWMDRLRRPLLSERTEAELNTMRKTDHEFYWLNCHGFPSRFFPPISWEVSGSKIPRHVEFLVSPGGTYTIRHPGEATTVWISPEVFDFENRCTVRVNGRTLYNNLLTPSAEALLEGLRESGDRERLYWARLDL